MVVPVFLCVLVRTTPSFPVTHEPVNELKCLNNNIYNRFLAYFRS